MRWLWWTITSIPRFSKHARGAVKAALLFVKGTASRIFKKSEIGKGRVISCACSGFFYRRICFRIGADAVPGQLAASGTWSGYPSGAVPGSGRQKRVDSENPDFPGRLHPGHSLAGRVPGALSFRGCAAGWDGCSLRHPGGGLQPGNGLWTGSGRHFEIKREILPGGRVSGRNRGICPREHGGGRFPPESDHRQGREPVLLLSGQGHFPASLSEGGNHPAGRGAQSVEFSCPAPARNRPDVGQIPIRRLRRLCKSPASGRHLQA